MNAYIWYNNEWQGYMGQVRGAQLIRVENFDTGESRTDQGVFEIRGRGRVGIWETKISGKLFCKKYFVV